MTGRPYIIAVAGGIGSGKSIVSRIVSAIGFPVYDCDSRAKWLMDSSDVIKDSISARIDPSCVNDGMIDRRTLAAIVFENPDKLSILNSIVHGAVRTHLASWIGDHSCTATGMCFVETAILYQSGLDAMADEVWMVDAPDELRISRVMQRNGLGRSEVESRIATQDSYVPTKPHSNIHIIINDGDTPLLPRIERLIMSIKEKI